MAIKQAATETIGGDVTTHTPGNTDTALTENLGVRFDALSEQYALAQGTSPETEREYFPSFPPAYETYLAGPVELSAMLPDGFVPPFFDNTPYPFQITPPSPDPTPDQVAVLTPDPEDVLINGEVVAVRTGLTTTQSPGGDVIVQRTVDFEWPGTAGENESVQFVLGGAEGQAELVSAIRVSSETALDSLSNSLSESDAQFDFSSLGQLTYTDTPQDRADQLTRLRDTEVIPLPEAIPATEFFSPQVVEQLKNADFEATGFLVDWQSTPTVQMHMFADWQQNPGDLESFPATLGIIADDIYGPNGLVDFQLNVQKNPDYDGLENIDIQPRYFIDVVGVERSESNLGDASDLITASQHMFGEGIFERILEATPE